MLELLDMSANSLYKSCMKKKKVSEVVYRPLLRVPYKRVALKIARKLNETALGELDDLDVCM